MGDSLAKMADKQSSYQTQYRPSKLDEHHVEQTFSKHGSI